MTRVKFCGLTQQEDIARAVKLGVDALGFVFYAPSSRGVTPDHAAILTSSVPAFVTRVGLFVNEQPVTAHLYTENERSSLGQGGVHQLFIGNLVDGRHTLKAVINARAANNRFVRREIVHDFRKQPGTLRLQMTLNAKAPDYEPEVSFVEWK